MFERIHHTCLTVNHLETSVAFYCARLGFVELVRREIRGGYMATLMGQADLHLDLAVLRLGDTKLELITFRQPVRRALRVAEGNPGGPYVSLLVRDVRGLFAKLRAQDVRFQSEPVAIDDGPNQGGWAVFLFDPDGYWVELLEFTPQRRKQLGME